MKCTPAFSAVIVLGLAACDTMNRPITSGDFDPLRPPGGTISPSTTNGPVFTAGQFVRAAMDNTAFFKNRPKGAEVDADKLLMRGTSMKVISTSESYVKVELDSGEVGFVPSVMVENPNAVSGAPTANPGEFQVYPPLGGFAQPLPAVTPGELPPEGAIPTVIDPEAPVTTNPVPPVTPTTETFPAPLPPNGEELKAEEKEVEKKAGEATPKPEPGE